MNIPTVVYFKLPMIWQLALKFLKHLTNGSGELDQEPTHHSESVTWISIWALQIINWNTFGYLFNSLTIYVLVFKKELYTEPVL